jgi:glutathione S-transferase
LRISHDHIWQVFKVETYPSFTSVALHGIRLDFVPGDLLTTKTSTEFTDLKKAPFETKINPNGRVPAITDPNTDITLWESGAIIEYLVETYDKDSTLNYTTFPEKYLLKQWLHFQMSGQGPYFGQAAWFNVLIPEKIPYAMTRYKDHVIRVLDVLNRALEGKQYLVGDKCTYADLSFLTWDANLPWLFGEEYASLEVETKYPNVGAQIS